MNDSGHHNAPGATAVGGGVRTVLRLEGLCLLVIATAVYARLDLGWGNFALFFFIPDLSFAAYLAGNRIGARGYNAAHSLIGALGCLAAGFLGDVSILLIAGLIWAAHIGFDRALGYGLKYDAGFSFTHLGRIGRRNTSAAAPSAEGKTP